MPIDGNPIGGYPTGGSQFSSAQKVYNAEDRGHSEFILTNKVATKSPARAPFDMDASHHYYQIVLFHVNTANTVTSLISFISLSKCPSRQIFTRDSHLKRKLKVMSLRIIKQNARD